MTNQLPPEIYRRRRIAAVVIIIVLLLLIGWGVSWALKARSNNENNSQDVTVTRTDGAQAEPPSETKQPYPSASETPSSEASAEVSADPKAAALAEKKDCTLPDLQLVASSDRPTYADEQPELALTLRNPTGGTCEIDLNQNKLRFEVYELATYKKVWADLDCHKPEQQGNVTIKPGEEATYTVKWSRLSSEPGKCTDAQRQPAAPGPYLFYGLVGDKNSQGYTFNLG